MASPCSALALSAWRFGLSDDALAARLEVEVQDIVRQQAASVTSLAQRVAAEGELIAEASASRDRLSVLFGRLRSLATQGGDRPVAVTIYVGGEDPGTYRVLAWSDGPGEQNLSRDRLAGRRPSSWRLATPAADS